jgi:hypothetical protein
MTTDPGHYERVMANVDALIARAKHPDNTYKPKNRGRTYSSLHEIIKTKEQADRFMAEMKRLRNK